jgi:hypothetical protein
MLDDQVHTNIAKNLRDILNRVYHQVRDAHLEIDLHEISARFNSRQIGVSVIFENFL